MIKNILGKRKKSVDTEMSFMDHLEDLRWHIFRSLLAVLVVGVILFINKSFLFDTLVFGPKDPKFLTYKFFCYLSTRFNLSDDICIREINYRIINRDISAPFMLHMQLAFVVGLIFCFPYVLYEIWRFVKPALYVKERKTVSGIVFISSLLFYVGAAFGYYLVAPFSINFLATYQISAQVENTVDLSSYIDSITGLVFACGLAFEFPLVVYFLARLGIVTANAMKKFRKYSIIIILLVAAVITPSPDMFSQIIVSLPLFVLYEISIVIAARTNKNIEDDIEEEVIQSE